MLQASVTLKYVQALLSPWMGGEKKTFRTGLQRVSQQFCTRASQRPTGCHFSRLGLTLEHAVSAVWVIQVWPLALSGSDGVGQQLRSGSSEVGNDRLSSLLRPALYFPDMKALSRHLHPITALNAHSMVSHKEARESHNFFFKIWFWFFPPRVRK